MKTGRRLRYAARERKVKKKRSVALNRKKKGPQNCRRFVGRLKSDRSVEGKGVRRGGLEGIFLNHRHLIEDQP